MPVLARQEIEIMLLDLWMPHVSGEELLRQITADHPGAARHRRHRAPTTSRPRSSA
ncbi:MAG: hypothetical protein MZU95_10900 [Desulfomicrobium escambiense]|nr:hypothetical protein [Desulfomicrobium escambiense]